MRSKQVPKAALIYSAGPFRFAETTKDGNIPVEMVARTGDSISHWYWGEVVHDLSGMQHRDSVPIDYNHDPADMMGVLNEFEAGRDLVTRGELVPFQDGDRVDEVTTKARAGVPYEASIDFSGGDLQISKYRQGESVNVNGREFSGPITVIDRWTLRAVAITPYGADPNTSTALNGEGGDTVPVLVKESKMPEKTLADMLLFVDPKTKEDARKAGLPFADAMCLTYGEPCEVDEKAAGKFIEAADIEAGWTWPENVTFKQPKPTIKPEGAGREEAARFEESFGLIGLQTWSKGGTFEDAAKAWREDHEAQLKSLEDENVKLKAENEALKMSDSDAAKVGDDPDGKPKKTLKEKFQQRADNLNTQK